MKIVAVDGLLENFTFCFEPDTIVAQLENNNNVIAIELEIIVLNCFSLRCMMGSLE
jgi:hypothetical protein